MVRSRPLLEDDSTDDVEDGFSNRSNPNNYEVRENDPDGKASRASVAKTKFVTFPSDKIQEY